MKQNPPIIHYSQLHYENISPYRKGRARVWYLEYEYNHVWHRLLRNIALVLTFTARRVFYWLKKEYRKEFLVGFILLFALIPPPKPVHAQAIPASVPAYLKPIPKLSPVAAVAFSVPVEVQPVTPPPAPVAAPVAPAPVAAPVYVAPAPITGCGDNFYAHYIYTHESGCSLTVTNYLGCLGIGQSCPASKLWAACPALTYACENQFFTSYANSAYGGWAGAYSFWVSHSWW